MITKEDVDKKREELENLEEQQKINNQNAEIVKKIKVIKRKGIMKILHDIKNGFLIVGRLLAKVFKSLFNIADAAGKNSASHNKPIGRRIKNKPIKKKSESKVDMGFLFDVDGSL